jgi:SDR family mycofactocin-dependent oxidoreductase
MAGRVEGKVAFITGVARGQGRSHAVRLAQEGADIIGIDICKQMDTVGYPMATPEDLEETVRRVEALDRRIVVTQADVRDFNAVKAAVDEGVAQLGHVDIVSANAGINSGIVPTWETSEAQWNETVDVDLNGVWHTCKASIPHIIEGGRGGAIVITSSGAGLKGMQNIGAYVAAKHGVIGLMRTLALELAPHHIRVNAICPGTVDTPIVNNEVTYRLFRPDLDDPGRDDVLPVMKGLHALPDTILEAVDISNALLWLASDEARYVTGVPFPVDAGFMVK